jgi:outer membrane lipoprotein-sorting protein
MRTLAQRFLIIVLITLIAACGRQPTADEVITQTRTALENFDQGHAIVEAQAIRQGESKRILAESWAVHQDEDDTHSQLRVEVREASEDDAVGSLAVSDGEVGWLYHPAKAKALTGERDALEAWREAQGDQDFPYDIDSLREAIDELLRISTITLVGEEQIAGRAAWHLLLVPNENAPPAWQTAGGNVDLWIDKASHLPLQARYSGGPAEVGEFSISVRQLDLDSPIDPALFTWTPPAGTEVIDVITLLPERLTLPDAKNKAPFPLLSTAADNAEVTLIEVVRQGDFYIQKFDGTAGEWRLIQGLEETMRKPRVDADASEQAHAQDRDEQHSTSEATTVRGQPATLRQNAESGHVALTWTEKGVVCTITGKLSPEAALTFAEGLR